MNTKKSFESSADAARRSRRSLLESLGLVLVPVGVATLFFGVGNASRGEEALGAALIAAGVGALVGAFWVIRAASPRTGS